MPASPDLDHGHENWRNPSDRPALSVFAISVEKPLEKTFGINCWQHRIMGPLFIPFKSQPGSNLAPHNRRNFLNM